MPDRGNAKSKRRRKLKSKNKNKNKDASTLHSVVGEIDAVPSISASSGDSSSQNIEASPIQDNESGISEKCVNISDVCCDNRNIESVIINENILNHEIPSTSTKIADDDNIPFREVINKKFYRVDSPENLNKTTKLSISSKSKSLDNDDEVILNITDVTDDIELKSGNNSYFSFNESNAVISEAESDVDWEVADEIENQVCDIINTAQGILSIETISLENAECEQAASLSPEEEKSLRLYLQTLNLATNPGENDNSEIGTRKDAHQLSNSEKQAIFKLKKARKKAEIEHFAPSCCKQRLLDVIDEEGSNESSETTRRHSTMSVNINSDYYDDLDDDVFINPKKPPPTPTEYYPLSRSKIKRNEELQKQECFLLGTKMVESNAQQSYGDWKFEKVDELRGAEIVYLDDSSSSTSEVYDTEGADADIETEDESVRIQTPTIEFNAMERSPIGTNKEITVQTLTFKNNFLPIKNDVSKTQENLPKIHIENPLHLHDVKPIPISYNEVTLTSNSVDAEVISNNTSIQNIETALGDSNIESFSETKIEELKLELNAAMKNLLRETMDENCVNDEFVRQDSSSSVCSSHSTSHSTAKYNPTNSSLVDIATIVHDEVKSASLFENNISPSLKHTITTNYEPFEQCVECVPGETLLNETTTETHQSALLHYQPRNLKDICVKKISSLPFGSAVLEELAAVANSLDVLSASRQFNNTPKVPPRKKKDITPPEMSLDHFQKKLPPALKTSPPPIGPRHSSLLITKDDQTWVGLATKTDPSLLACLSPSQKNYIDRIKKLPGSDEAGTLIDMHNKYIDRRGYHEYTTNGTLTSEAKNNDDKTSMQPNHAPSVKTQQAPAIGNRLLAIIQDPSLNSIVKLNTNNTYSTSNQNNSNISGDNLLSHHNVYSTTEMHSNYENSTQNISDIERIQRSEYYSNEKSYKATLKDSDSQIYENIKDRLKETYERRQPRSKSGRIIETNENIEKTVNKNIEYMKTCNSYSVSNNSKHTSQGAESKLNQLLRKREFILEDPVFDIPKDKNRPKDTIKKLSPTRRRFSLPKDLYERQMQYILRKEKEIEDEICKLEKERLSNEEYGEFKEKLPGKAPLLTEDQYLKESSVFDARNYFISRQGDVATIQNEQDISNKDKDRSRSVPTDFSSEEKFRQEMYSEYMNKVAEREERKQLKVIKITSQPQTSGVAVGSFPLNCDSTQREIKQTCGLIEEEFITKAKERWEKMGFKDPETEDEIDNSVKKTTNENVFAERTSNERKKIKVIDGGEEKEIAGLPNHLREFVQFTANDTSSPAIWSPGATTPTVVPSGATPTPAPRQSSPAGPPAPPAPVWTPSSGEPSPQAQRKFRPVSFESPKLVRKVQQVNRPQEDHQVPQGPVLNGLASQRGSHPPPPPPQPLTSSLDRRLPTSHSAPSTGLSAYSTTSRLPKAQNPTITLLQKAREGQLPRGATYLTENHQFPEPRARKSTPPRAEPGYSLRKGYASEGEGEEGRRRRMTDLGHSKIDGVGPTTNDGMPVALRSEVKDQSKWYKKMYDTIHRNKYDGDYVTVRYKPPRRDQNSSERAHTPRSSQYAYFDPRSGYLSEPAGGGWSDAYDSDAPRRRRTTSAQSEQRELHSEYLPSNKYSTLASAKASKEIYKNQPGRIENYVPGRSSVVEKESKQWWDEVMDIFDGQLSNSTIQPPSGDKKDITSSILSKSNMARALKESGYESDSTLVFRRRSPVEAPLSPDERRQAYRSLQAGGEPPLQGFRKPAPERPREPDWAPELPPKGLFYDSDYDQESPRRYVESDVNIHYRVPVVQEPRPLVPEHELARRQAEHMKRVYQEERRRKYLQELQDMNSRRHADNFTPSQKSPVSLHRYDDLDKFPADVPTKTLARALYSFKGQSQKELSFKRGDVIVFRRQVDPNWYEGEVNGRIGIFPKSYVESHRPLLPTSMSSGSRFGLARALYDFVAQTPLELPLRRGQVVTLTNRVDKNWWEGRNQHGSRGIFPESYIEVLQEPAVASSPCHGGALDQPRGSFNENARPVGSPAAHSVVRGTGKQSMGGHHYTPQLNSPNLNAPGSTEPLTSRPAKSQRSPVMPRVGNSTGRKVGPHNNYAGRMDLNNTQPLYVDTNAEAVPYRAMYKYRPQNSDELELMEGDTVYVLEKCDDGWFVGSSQRTGNFGTFPGNYVTKIM